MLLADDGNGSVPSPRVGTGYEGSVTDIAKCGDKASPTDGTRDVVLLPESIGGTAQPANIPGPRVVSSTGGARMVLETGFVLSMAVGREREGGASYTGLSITTVVTGMEEQRG